MRIGARNWARKSWSGSLVGSGLPSLSLHLALYALLYAVGAIATLTADSLVTRETPNFWEALNRKSIGIAIGWPAFLVGLGAGLCVRFLNSLFGR